MIRQYVVDAFTDQVFHGNQAAVCVLDAWPSEALMLSIARENNFSETAFTVKEGDEWRLRWFTPGGEIDLCGHATLATAFIIPYWAERLGRDELTAYQASARGGTLFCRREGDKVFLAGKAVLYSIDELFPPETL